MDPILIFSDSFCVLGLIAFAFKRRVFIKRKAPLTWRKVNEGRGFTWRKSVLVWIVDSPVLFETSKQSNKQAESIRRDLLIIYQFFDFHQVFLFFYVDRRGFASVDHIRCIRILFSLVGVFSGIE
jgi:hypothetical protein